MINKLIKLLAQFIIGLFFGWSITFLISERILILKPYNLTERNYPLGVEDMSRKYEELEKLAELKDKGVIDEKEFNKEKSKILNKENNRQQSDNYNFGKRPSSQEESNKNFGLIGLILAIVSLVTPIQIIDFIIGLVAIYYSYKGVSKRSPKKIAIVAIVVAVIATLGALTAPFIHPEVYLF